MNLLVDSPFADKIQPEPMSGCWLWVGTIGVGGYGIVSNGRNKKPYAHRCVYIASGREIPHGLQLDHLCRVRSCVNPDHLRPVTQRENLLAPGSLSGCAINHRKTHCRQGHEFTAENTRYGSKGGRLCRQCVNKRLRELYAIRCARRKELSR